MIAVLRPVFLFILVLLPVVLLGYYTYYQDSEKESKRFLIKLFFGGFISAALTVFFSYIIRCVFPFFYGDITQFSMPKLLVYCFIIVSLVEEISKFIIVYSFSYNNREYDQLYDMIVYSVFVSLGFALIENLLYSYDGGIKIAISRSLFAVPTHVSVAVFMGYYLSISKFYSVKNNEKSRNKKILLSILVPMLLHGTYDFLVYVSNYNYTVVLFFFLFTCGLIINANRRLHRLAKTNDYIIPNKSNDLEVI